MMLYPVYQKNEADKFVTECISIKKENVGLEKMIKY